MKQVRFITNASCPEGVFGEGATAVISDAQAEQFAGSGTVEILGDAPEQAVEETTTETPRRRRTAPEGVMTSENTKPAGD